MKKLASLSVTFTFGMAVLSMPTPALAQATLVEIGDTGELTDAGVVVPVTVACVDDSEHADIDVQLVQGRAGGDSDLLLLNPNECGSTPQTVHVLVRPNPNIDGPFDLGGANAFAVHDACDSSGNNCNDLFDDNDINVVD